MSGNITNDGIVKYLSGEKRFRLDSVFPAASTSAPNVGSARLLGVIRGHLKEGVRMLTQPYLHLALCRAA